jgi:HSP20 family protein
MTLEHLASGRRILASEDRGPHARGCHLNASALEENRVFDTFLGRGFGRFSAPSRIEWSEELVPSIDVRETDTDLIVEAELPGMDEKDVSVTLSNGVLTVKGEKKSEREEKEEDYHLMERSYGSFQRSFRLADTIDPDKVTAAFDKGVLKITLGKRPEVVKAEKRIPIAKS